MIYEKYFLSSLEDQSFENPRECILQKKIFFDTGKECFIACINPPQVGQIYGLGGEDIKYLFLSARHQGNDISDIQEFPCFVHILIPVNKDVLKKDVLAKEDFHHISWGELYRTKEDAENHVFDT